MRSRSAVVLTLSLGLAQASPRAATNAQRGAGFVPTLQGGQSCRARSRNVRRQRGYRSYCLDSGALGFVSGRRGTASEEGRKPLKLYLSSYRHGHDPDALRGLVGRSDAVAALIFNACDGYGGDRLQNLPRERDDLKQCGFDGEELDLRLYFDDFDGLCDRVARYDLLWVVGGNAFVLAKAMTASRFAEAVDGQIEEERLVYAGYSAGTCAAAPDL